MIAWNRPGVAMAVALLMACGPLSAQLLPATRDQRDNDQPFCDGYELVPTCALPPKPPPILLEQVSPLPGDPESPSIQFRAGWPLIFRASIADDEFSGIGRVYGEQGFEPQGWEFAEIGQGAALVFTDPDGTWSFSIPSAVSNDERIVDFYPDHGDSTGVLEDVAGAPFTRDPTSRFNLRPEFGGPLPQTPLGFGIIEPVIEDGVQFGADDDFPGLVILSNVGVGIVMESLEDGWTPVFPRAARNLAGFTNSVGYELSDSNGRTSITSVMIVPRFLFSQIRLQDPCVGTVLFNTDGEPESCTGSAIERIDGGPIGPLQPRSSIDESVVEIRAFVVEPVWNGVTGRLDYMDTVIDANNDLQVTAADAEAMGRRVLSNEVVFTVRQIGNNVVSGQIGQYGLLALCNGITRPRSGRAGGADFQYDIDGNGYSALVLAVVCPGGGSGVIRPPR